MKNKKVIICEKCGQPIDNGMGLIVWNQDAERHVTEMHVVHKTPWETGKGCDVPDCLKSWELNWVANKPEFFLSLVNGKNGELMATDEGARQVLAAMLRVCDADYDPSTVANTDN